MQRPWRTNHRSKMLPHTQNSRASYTCVLSLTHTHTQTHRHTDTQTHIHIHTYTHTTHTHTHTATKRALICCARQLSITGWICRDSSMSGFPINLAQHPRLHFGPDYLSLLGELVICVKVM